MTVASHVFSILCALTLSSQTLFTWTTLNSLPRESSFPVNNARVLPWAGSILEYTALPPKDVARTFWSIWLVQLPGRLQSKSYVWNFHWHHQLADGKTGPLMTIVSIAVFSKLWVQCMLFWKNAHLIQPPPFWVGCFQDVPPWDTISYQIQDPNKGG